MKYGFIIIKVQLFKNINLILTSYSNNNNYDVNIEFKTQLICILINLYIN